MQTASFKAALVLTAFAVLTLGFIATSSAGTLAVGTPMLPVDSQAGQPSPGAILVAGDLDANGIPDPIPFSSFGLTYSGTLASGVWMGDTTNPFYDPVTSPNVKTFTYLLTNDASSTNVLHRLTVGSYGGPVPILTDVSYDPNTPGVSPTLADRSTADVIGFTFADTVTGIPQLLGNIPAGGQSKLLVVQTNAVDFLPSFASVIDGSVTVVASWAPITQIPEPSTCVLAGMGLVGLVIGVARRRRS
jgi:hypothetical protein